MAVPFFFYKKYISLYRKEVIQMKKIKKFLGVWCEVSLNNLGIGILVFLVISLIEHLRTLVMNNMYAIKNL